jgi:hypothetical protein
MTGSRDTKFDVPAFLKTIRGDYSFIEEVVIARD